MSGDILFGGHWEAGFALRILDRSDARGSFNNKITSQRLATVVTSQDGGGCSFSPSHYCSSDLFNTRGYDFGFYIYYNQGAVYDRYWSEYAVWVVSNNNVYFRSCDGAIIALTSGNPQASHEPRPVVQQSRRVVTPVAVAVIPHTEARRWDGQTVTVTGTLRFVFNNRKQVLLGFSNPHRGTFKVIIHRQHWGNFPRSPEQMYQVGQPVEVTGTIAWYQGDPCIYATTPDQIRVTTLAQRNSTDVR
jgi:hypothetical protein